MPVKVSTLPPFMGGKNLRKYQKKDNSLEYIKKWSVKNDTIK
jgi:hypothetical protein